MERKNVDQRFPDKGGNPRRGKPGTDYSGRKSQYSSVRENKADTPISQQDDRPPYPRKQLIRQPRIVKRGDMEDAGAKRPWVADRDKPSYPQRTERYSSVPPLQRKFDSNRDDYQGRTNPSSGNESRFYRHSGNQSFSNRQNPRNYGKVNKRPYQSPGKPGKPRPLGPGEMYTPPPHPEGIRINRYIANAGICSRRDADKLVEAGEISVNGVVVNTLGARIDPGDVVTYKGIHIHGEKLRYVLLNKPKGYITTNDDPEGRATVIELINEACDERVFPVGRLDRNTTGLILFTNDGMLAEKLMHPRNLVKKLYHIKLDKPITIDHIKKISKGIKLEDGYIKADNISYVGTVDDRTEIGLEIHSGKNRIVRRIFESLEYEVIKLDRVMFAGLTKKDLRRGKWRHLTKEEVNYLKML